MDKHRLVKALREERAETAIPAHVKKGPTQSMAHAPHKAERVIEKALIVRFFADGGFRVEGPFPPMQVQRLIDTSECQAWLRNPALFAIWRREPVANVSEQLTLWPEINEIASRLAHKRYQPLKANHYRAQHARHWQDKNRAANWRVR